MTKILILLPLYLILTSLPVLASQDSYELYLQGHFQAAYDKSSLECEDKIKDSCALAAILAFHFSDRDSFNALAEKATKQSEDGYFKAQMLINSNQEKQGELLAISACKSGDRAACSLLIKINNKSYVESGCSAGEAYSCEEIGESEKACLLGLKSSCLDQSKSISFRLTTWGDLYTDTRKDGGEKRKLLPWMLSGTYLDRWHTDLALENYELKSVNEKRYAKIYLGLGPNFNYTITTKLSFRILPSLGLALLSYKHKFQVGSKIFVPLTYRINRTELLLGPIYSYESPTLLDQVKIGGGAMGLATALSF